MGRLITVKGFVDGVTDYSQRLGGWVTVYSRRLGGWVTVYI